ncbi:CopM family metallochaperone [Methylobrevis pamukkalensis]|uniref:DUF305 domain-containing protein n=1 Tax=Methylobrevis pamukkalensis TaxID=1439726 RepID=A0A1E3H3N0_9HYPH|nr:DUF305 domain-containing protein [Methylobrevis pamukkalensis]ODN70957.1 hypothetical protein A6302_01729 [Methylobrevis pamukkalensis]
MKRRITILGPILLAATLVTAGAVIAQEDPEDDGMMQMDHGNHGPMEKMETAADSPSSAEFLAANTRMHEAMNVPLTGDADVDFVRSMIPHHQGAIDMAEIVLKHGKDPAIRKLAEEIVAAQEKEIAEMNAWLDKNGQ